MNKEFIKKYAENMKANSDANPGLYLIPASWEALSEKMCHSILAGSANVSDMAKKTAKQLGFAGNIKGVKAAISV